MAIIHAETVEEHDTVPTCPICHQMDQVRHLAAAYSRGDVQLKMLHLPRSERPRLWPWVLVPAIIYLFANGYLFAQMGSASGFGSWPPMWQVLEVIVVEASLLLALILSLRAFGRLLRAEQETVWQYPTESEGAENWRRLYHCQREGIVFDAQLNQVLPEDEQRHWRRLNIEGMKARHARLTDQSFAL